MPKAIATNIAPIYGPVVRSVLYGAAILGDNWCRKVRHLLKPNPPTTQPTGTKMWFGSTQLVDKFHQFFNKFWLLRKLYRKKIPLCKHEVAFHEVRALSYANWYPVRSSTATITPKFHVMIYEHSRFIKKHKVLGLFTEECIEALHKAENESKNLTSAIRFNH